MYNQIASNKRKTAFFILLTILLVGGLGYLFGYLYDAGPVGLVYALLISVVLSLVSYFSGDKLVLMTSGAQRIAKEDQPYVYRMVENTCIAGGIPVPRVYIINDPAMNAFATGRDPEHASIAVTTGLIENLENEELEGVIAHELSHVKNFDVRLMMIVATLIGVVILMSDFMLRAQLFGGSRRRSNDSGGAGAILAIVGLLAMILAPIFAQLIKLAVSRKREFLADASGAMLTRYPQGLANALRKIGAQNRPLQHANASTAHLFFSNPFGTHDVRSFLSKLFSTHPPIEERIKALEGMTQ
ncbi:MAG: M48 family metalloprotease [Candidatus Kerfeldbacteria bacterium]|nr:M48 family metalloprotease [Candidatus Kerfeldbacteria bacterium]